MSDNYAPVILVSSDDKLIQAISDCRPPGCEFTVVDPRSLSLPHPAGKTRWWIDVEGLETLDWGKLPRAGVIFTNRPLEQAPPLGTLIVHKPWTTRMLQNLWEPQPALPVEFSPAEGSLPAWILEFHEQNLPELCRRIVDRLPEHLGYRETSLYLYNAEQHALNLAECNHDAALALSIPVTSNHPSPMLEAARQRGSLELSAARAWLDDHGVVREAEYRTYEDDRCLILPLISEDRIQGIVNLNHRVSQAPLMRDWLKPLTTFLARSLRFACELEASRTEARIDELTSLYNYRCAIETIESEIRRAARYVNDLSVVMIDLDGLKRVNDSRGHAAGNVLIRHVANKIRMALRRFDTAARVGGDEFIVILPATDTEGAKRVAQRILESVRDDAAIYEDEPLPISASLGIAQWQPEWSSAELLEAADQAMYAAKRSNRVGRTIERDAVTTIHELVAAKIEGLDHEPHTWPSPQPKA